jgi:hypothetical protein
MGSDNIVPMFAGARPVQPVAPHGAMEAGMCANKSKKPELI